MSRLPAIIIQPLNAGHTHQGALVFWLSINYLHVLNSKQNKMQIKSKQKNDLYCVGWDAKRKKLKQ